MNSTQPVQNKFLDSTKEALVDKAIDQTFQNDPKLLFEIDRRLSNFAQKISNQRDAATYPATPVPNSTIGAPGTPGAKRKFMLADTDSQIGPDVEVTNHYETNDPATYLYT